MAEPKTKPTGASVDDYIASRASPEQKTDCRKLMAILKRATGERAKMWGPSIVGYGTYTYTYATGRTGDWPVAGFAIRGRELVVYLMTGGPEKDALLARLGKHRIGKSCLYIKRLADLDIEVLEELVVQSVADVRRRYPSERNA